MIQKPKILVVPQSYPSSERDIKGIFIKDYVSTVKDACEVNLFITYFSKSEEKVLTTEENGIMVTRMYIRQRPGVIGKAWAYLRWLLRAYSYLKKNFSDAQLVHTHGGTIPGILTTFFAKRQQIPSVITEHTGPFSKISDQRLLWYLCKYSMENSAAVLPVSHDLERQIIESGIRPQNVRVLHNPVDTDLFTIRPEIEKEKEILFVGRLEAYKGGLRIVKAFASIRAQIPGWKLKFIGDGPERKVIEEYIHAHQLEDDVQLMGQKIKREIAAALNRSSVFIFPSEHETFGLVVAEAMASGVPVVTANSSAFPEYVNTDHGKLVDPQSVEAISEGLLSLINGLGHYDPQILRNQIMERYSFRAFGTRLINLYKELID